MESLLFTPAKIGPIEIKNRVIRASAYEGMCDGHPSTASCGCVPRSSPA